MNCVKCNGELLSNDHEGVTVDQCEACGGVWFPRGALARTLGLKDASAIETPRPLDKAADAKRGSCPSCGGSGKLVQLASTDDDVHIDTCSVCGGQWLDAGELAALRGEGGLRPVFKLVRKLFGS